MPSERTTLVSVQYLIGDVFDRMAELEDGSVDLILTSPPFLALRSYLPADHPDKDKEIGSEATPAEFIDVMLRLTAEWRRLLAPHGSLCVELGDTYSGSGGAGGDYQLEGIRAGQPVFDGSARRNAGGDRKNPFNTSHGTGGMGWPLAKSLALVPESYRFALAYGINPHTGAESPAGKWRIRNVIRWVRPNPPVGALGDKFRPATSELVVACTSGKRWFDLDAVRLDNYTPRSGIGKVDGHELARVEVGLSSGKPGRDNNLAGAPPLDWWKISPTGYAGAHYAVWPPELCIKPVKAMSPERVCRTCGKPSERITETTNALGKAVNHRQHNPDVAHRTFDGDKNDKSIAVSERQTLGWSDCGHDNWRPGRVLDPFAGTGTTLAVAHGHGRDAIGIDINPRNAELARERVGPLFFEVSV